MNISTHCPPCPPTGRLAACAPTGRLAAGTPTGRLASGPPTGRLAACAPTGRLAPSPTGHLHLGNAWSFLLAWLSSRSQGGRLLLRMEDLDPDRSKPSFAAAIIEDLLWLGLDFDGDMVLQSQRHQAHTAALHTLSKAGRAYPCYCTRKELRSLAGAPHIDDHGAPYPGTCRHLTSEQRAAAEASGRKPAMRLLCPEDAYTFEDKLYGAQSFTLAELGGDFALRRSDGVMAYQLAVVVDDAAMGVSEVVRGRDILVSTPRQMALMRMLDLPVPRYAHVPLLLDEEGQRLAKRHQSLSLRSLREAGLAPEVVVGLLAHLAGQRESPCPLHPRELVDCFDIQRVRPQHGEDIMLTHEHMQLLKTVS